MCYSMNAFTEELLVSLENVVFLLVVHYVRTVPLFNNLYKRIIKIYESHTYNMYMYMLYVHVHAVDLILYRM